MTESKPTEFPPQAVAAMTGSEPNQSPEESSTTKFSTAKTAPSLTPPESQGTANGGITAWQNDRRITALWSINENRNVWVHVLDVGWKKFADNSDSAIVAFSLLAAQAKQMEAIVNFRDEADGKIYEMYVW